MNRHLHCFLISLLAIFFLFNFLYSVTAKNTDVTVEFFYSEGCDSCDEKKGIINNIEVYYNDNITLLHLEYSSNKDKFNNYGFTTIPAVVIRNETNITKFAYEEIIEENLKVAIDAYINGSSYEKPNITEQDQKCISTFFGEFCFNVSQWSLPALTIVLGALDSINPCSFFVLLFLLSLLVYTKSRKRMLLVGGLFVFFSAFIYFLLMFIIMFVYKNIEEQTVILLIGGFVAVIFGILNIKDFFFFKKGPSLSISDDKKSKLYNQVRNIIKITSIPALIGATIVFAISTNMVELVCSLNVPVVYTTALITFPMSEMQYYIYLIFYNIIYVLPLIFIVIVMVVTLGRWKLSEWQGRKLKLFSGVMMFLIGVIMLIDPVFLRNIMSVMLVLLISILSTMLLSYIWKKNFKENKSFEKQ